MPKGKRKVEKEIRKIVKENHCRYCSHVGGDDVLSDRCNGDVDFVVEEIIRIVNRRIDRDMLDKHPMFVLDKGHIVPMKKLPYHWENEYRKLFIPKVKRGKKVVYSNYVEDSIKFFRKVLREISI